MDYIDGQICHKISKYLSEIQGYIKLNPIYVHKPLQTYNIAIIDDETSLLHFTHVQQRQENCV